MAQEEKEKCAYCRKERNPEDLKEGKILVRTRVNGRACNEWRTSAYCVDTGCRGKDQMAHEG